MGFFIASSGASDPGAWHLAEVSRARCSLRPIQFQPKLLLLIFLWTPIGFWSGLLLTFLRTQNEIVAVGRRQQWR